MTLFEWRLAEAIRARGGLPDVVWRAMGWLRRGARRHRSAVAWRGVANPSRPTLGGNRGATGLPWALYATADSALSGGKAK